MSSGLSSHLTADGSHTSDESARSEIYVQTYPRSGIKIKISSQGGSQQKWRGDGKEIYYLALDGKVMAVSVSTKPEFTPGVPVALYNYRLATGLTRNNYDVTNDRQRFLVISAAEESTASPLTIILNWTGLLNK